MRCLALTQSPVETTPHSSDFGSPRVRTVTSYYTDQNIFRHNDVRESLKEHRLHVTYDRHGRPYEVHEQLDDKVLLVFSFDYNENGKLTRMTANNPEEPLNPKWDMHLSYNVNGQPKRALDPRSPERVLRYFFDGTRCTQIYLDSTAINFRAWFQYDEQNRVREFMLGGSVQAVEWQNDLITRIASSQDPGTHEQKFRYKNAKLSEVSNEAGEYSYINYDHSGRISRIEQTSPFFSGRHLTVYDYYNGVLSGVQPTPIFDANYDCHLFFDLYGQPQHTPSLSGFSSFLGT